MSWKNPCADMIEIGIYGQRGDHADVDPKNRNDLGSRVLRVQLSVHAAMRLLWPRPFVETTSRPHRQRKTRYSLDACHHCSLSSASPNIDIPGRSATVENGKTINDALVVAESQSWSLESETVT